MMPHLTPIGLDTLIFNLAVIKIKSGFLRGRLQNFCQFCQIQRFLLASFVSTSDLHVSKGASAFPARLDAVQTVFASVWPAFRSDSNSMPGGHCGYLQLLPFLVPSFFHNSPRFYLVSLATTTSLFSSMWMHFKYLRTAIFLSPISFIGQAAYKLKFFQPLLMRHVFRFLHPLITLLQTFSTVSKSIL